MYKEVEGDLVELGLQGKFDVVAQGNNCFCVQGAGLAPQFVKAWRTDTFKMEGKKYEGDINKLGTIDWNRFLLTTGDKLAVVNCYTQYGFGRNHKEGSTSPLDYEALTLCMRKINNVFAGKKIGLPYVIGCGLAGGDPGTVIAIIKRELCNCDVTMVKLP